MARLYLKKTLTGFQAADEPSREAWSKFKLGEVYRSDVVKPRSYKHHKQIMALLNLTYENQDRWSDFESFRKAVALAAGHTEEVIGVDGEIHRLPASLSYDRLDELEFTKVAGAMMTVCAHILHDMDLGELEAEVSKYCDQNYGRAA